VYFDVAIAPLQRLRRILRDRGGAAIAQQARVSRQVGAGAAAEQAVQRQAGGLAGDVPQRDVDARQRVQQRTVPAHAVQHALQLVMQRDDLGRIAADAQRPDQRIERGAGRREDAVAEGLAPAGDAGIGINAHEQHIDAGARPPAEQRRGAVDHHRQVEDDAFDARNLHRHLESNG
jgi:hypothetical protein